MAQKLELTLDTVRVWDRVAGRRSVFLDTSCWINLADEVSDTARQVRHRLKDRVASGELFCPLSWGILEELFKQSGPSLEITARLMEELSLNAIFRMRTDLNQWELSRSIRHHLGEPIDTSLRGLFLSPFAFLGSALQLIWKGETPLSPEVREEAEELLKLELSAMGVAQLAAQMGGSRLKETPPAYGAGAKKLRARLKGNKKALFLEEAANCFNLYVTPLLLSYPLEVVTSWTAKFGPPEEEETWLRNALDELPSLHNHIEIMMAMDLQPERRDKHSDFMDNEIIVAPVTYASVFVAKDRGIRDMLQNRTQILNRAHCHYCDSLDSLGSWLRTELQ